MKIANKTIVSVDVGGTFCDVWCEQPDHISTFKILSTGKLRATIEKSISGHRCIIRQAWNLPHPQVLLGCTFNTKTESAAITSFNPTTNEIILKKKINLSVGDFIEIDAQMEAPAFAAHLLTGIPIGQPLKNVQLNIGTTKCTNALLELKGRGCVYITNKGMQDLLYIKTQQRPHLFSLDIEEPVMLNKKNIEIDARINYQGEIEVALTQTDLNRITSQLPREKSTPIAIALMHSYLNPKHEVTIKKHLVRLGYPNVSISAELLPSIHLLPRAQTAVCNAYLSTVLTNFKDSLLIDVDSKSLNFITSAGYLKNSNEYEPKDSLFSGPAGGIKAAESISNQYNIPKLITFDMGGTSTDTARIHQSGSLRFNSKIGSFDIVSESYEIETVAAGGGSIIDYKDGKFTVGPGSAGADPGPACYGFGGPLTLTDVNLLLGRLDPSAFSIPVNENAALEKFKTLVGKADIPYSTATANEILLGLLTIANEKMAEAIKKISVSSGNNPAEYNLLVYGGAGGVHACGVADRLGIDKILIPQTAGIFSARGVSHARKEKIIFKQINKPLHQVNIHQSIQNILTKEIKSKKYTIQKSVYLRYKGQSTSLEINYTKRNLRSRFEDTYQKIYGSQQNTSIEVEKIVLKVATSYPSKANRTKISTKSHHSALSGTSFEWNQLKTGDTISGPATVYHHQATVYIESGWQAVVQKDLDLYLNRINAFTKKRSWHQSIELELFSNRFMAIAEQMGEQLRHSAFSVNVKERLDFSCAILDPKGRLIANAPHIPVHLGSLGISARKILKEFPVQEGDVILYNHPLYGGSHLPDITLLKGVFHDHRLIGYVINRAHHAEIGGKVPGSMPPDARTLIEEGVIIHPTYLIKNHKPNLDELNRILNKSKYPSRNTESNILDIQAAVESLNAGEKKLQLLTSHYGYKIVLRQMNAILKQSIDLIASFIKENQSKSFQATEYLDDCHKINCTIELRSGKMHIDLRGSSGVHPFNLNANDAILYSVTLYVLRLICTKEVPLNDGLLKHVVFKTAPSFITPRFYKEDTRNPAVVGGNTEVSQRLTDTFIKAFGLAACSQGTMNNFLFGNEYGISYYETIGGGAGATRNANGRSAIHQHMTNTKITDPEELESRYPVQLEKFEIRKNSGGKGCLKGGDGIIRQIKFNTAMKVTILAQHRKELPFGMEGGEPGKTGKTYLIKNGRKNLIDSNQSFNVEQGDQVLIETPGGGGFGKKVMQRRKSILAHR